MGKSERRIHLFKFGMDEEMGEKRRQDKIYTEKNSERSQSEVTRGYCGLGEEQWAGSPVLALPLPGV